jgi:hypothetical protein
MRILSRGRILAGSCLYALAGLVPASPVASAALRVDQNDVKLLEASLAFELSAIKAYADAAAAGTLLSPAVFAVVETFMKDHVAHRDALIVALRQMGAGPVVQTIQPANDHPVFLTEPDVLNAAYALERSSASTHFASISALHNRDLTKISAQILGVETTHVALLAEALHKGFAYPSGFVGP